MGNYRKKLSQRCKSVSKIIYFFCPVTLIPLSISLNVIIFIFTSYICILSYQAADQQTFITTKTICSNVDITSYGLTRRLKESPPEKKYICSGVFLMHKITKKQPFGGVSLGAPPVTNGLGPDPCPIACPGTPIIRSLTLTLIMYYTKLKMYLNKSNITYY